MLANQRKAIYAQRNYFFDSPDGRVSKFRRTLRIRFFDDDKAVLTIKARSGPLPQHPTCSASMMPEDISRHAESAARHFAESRQAQGHDVAVYTSGAPGDEGRRR